MSVKELCEHENAPGSQSSRSQIEARTGQDGPSASLRISDGDEVTKVNNELTVSPNDQLFRRDPHPEPPPKGKPAEGEATPEDEPAESAVD